MDFGTVTRNVQWFEETMLVLVIQSEGFLLNLRQMGIQGMPNLKISKKYIYIFNVLKIFHRKYY